MLNSRSACMKFLQGCHMAKSDPFLSLDCTAPGWRVVGAIQGKEGIKFCHLATLEKFHTCAPRVKHAAAE